MPALGLYPRQGPRPTDSTAEKALYRALSSQLPDGWTAWHSLRIRFEGQYEGEGDFVVAIPGRGILVLEVKGGAIEIRDGQWRQNGKPMKRAPRDQAHRYKNGLMRRLEATCQHSIPWVAIACAFPDTPFSVAPTEGGVGEAVLGQQDLPFLKEALQEIAARELEKARPPRGHEWMDALHALWCETWTPILSLGDKTKLREQELIALDADQLGLLDQIDESPRMLVRGGAGTGKTLVAREMYRRLERAGRRPLYLCSTSALAAGLRAWGIEHAWTVRQHAARLLEQAEVPMQGGLPSSQWKPETWELAPLQAATDALPALESPYDAVVVDEGQDMSSTDWDLVQAIAGDGVLWVFADARQGFWENRAVPEGVLPALFKLVKRYRCPEPLARFADRYAGGDVAGGDDGLTLPIQELRVVRVPTQQAVADKVALEIQKVRGQGMKPSDIAVLTLAGQSRTTLGVADKIGAFDVVRADDARASEQVIADTFLRFKGLERPWIIVTEIYLGERRYDVRMHVALTRATVGCVVVATAEQIDKDRRLEQAMG
ncbi:MAG: NERD domain-containing protein [Deltaproteobacteria bacterium]|jgi:hypothetical protein|nr:NERD domain-containing protein [Deltaproteobacteria bacterium]MBW2536395.1 NERD domain-containing protein [Deltaproteobacteria bacterium]